MPMVFWLNDGDLAIRAVCWAGAGLSLMLVFNLLPHSPGSSCSALRALSFTALCRADIHELPVGYVPCGRRRAPDELQADHRRFGSRAGSCSR